MNFFGDASRSAKRTKGGLALLDSFRAQTRTLEFMVIRKPGPCQQLIVHRPPDPSHFSPPRQRFSARVVLPPQRTPAMSGDILGRHSLRRWRCYGCSVSRRQGCCCTSSYPWDSPPTTQSYPAPNIQPDSAEAEKPCPRRMALDKPGCPREACAEYGFRLSGK